MSTVAPGDARLNGAAGWTFDALDSSTTNSGPMGGNGVAYYVEIPIMETRQVTELGTFVTTMGSASTYLAALYDQAGNLLLDCGNIASIISNGSNSTERWVTLPSPVSVTAGTRVYLALQAVGTCSQVPSKVVNGSSSFGRLRGQRPYRAVQVSTGTQTWATTDAPFLHGKAGQVLYSQILFWTLR